MNSPDFGPMPFTSPDGTLTPAAKTWLTELVRELAEAQAALVAQAVIIADLQAAP